MMPIRNPILLVLIWLLIVAIGGFWVWQSAKKKMSSSSNDTTIQATNQ